MDFCARKKLCDETKGQRLGILSRGLYPTVERRRGRGSFIDRAVLLKADTSMLWISVNQKSMGNDNEREYWFSKKGCGNAEEVIPRS